MSTQQLDPSAPSRPEPAVGPPAGPSATASGASADQGLATPGERPALGTVALPRRAVNSLMWAVLIPCATVVAGFLSQYPFGMLYVGIVVTLVVVAVSTIIVGLRWGRTIAAVLAAMCVFALPFVAGPTTYEVYAKHFGHAVTAHITPGTHCHVVDSEGASEELTGRQNCSGQFEPGQSVVLFRDPFGVLHPWVEATGSRAVGARGLAESGGLAALSVAVILCAGLFRRPSHRAF